MKAELGLIFGFILLMGMPPLGHSYSPHEDPVYHLGANCTPCHEKFQVENPDVRDMFPCAKKACHQSGIRWGNGSRFAIHLNQSICFGCHVSVSGEYDVHLIHRGEVNCKICHQSFRGWNSSVATIPVPDTRDTRVVDGIRIAIPRDRECGYCHPSVREPGRLHDVHAPVLEQACDACHSRRHTGNICFSCHESFAVNSTSVQPGNCKENGCHSRSASERQELHLKKDLCMGCHPAPSGEYDIHLIHRGEVNCRVCHQSFRGWNSSIATVPVPREEDIVILSGSPLPGGGDGDSGEVRMAIHREKECKYCHPSAWRPRRLHDVHSPVLEKACDACHNRTKYHSGNLCISCHDALSLNSLALRPSNCKDNGCHSRTPTEIQGLHTQKNVCVGCHNSTSGELEVHSIHRSQINCRVCHQSFRGWNSSVATIPAPRPGDIKVIEGIRLAIPGEKECAYCHLTARTPVRLHDVHAPILEDSCPRCHVNQSFEEEVGKESPLWRLGRRINRSISKITKKTVDISCGNCHGDLLRNFYTDNRTAWMAKLHMWAGSADNFFGPTGEVRYVKNFTTDMESNSCLLCHVVEEVNLYKAEHTRISLRSCTNETCHGDVNTRGSETFVGAGYLGLAFNYPDIQGPEVVENLNVPGGIHDKETLQGRYLDWRVCVECHYIHPRGGMLDKIWGFLKRGG